MLDCPPPADDGFGIDWITLSFPLSAFEEGAFHWRRGNRQALGDFGGVKASVTKLSDGQLIGGLELPGGVLGRGALCPVNNVEQRVEEVLGRTASLWTLEGDFRTSSLNRCDVTRDFAMVTPIPTILEAMRYAPAIRARKRNLYTDPRTGIAQSLYIGTGSAGIIRLYETARTHPSSAPQILRVEVQGRAWLTRHGHSIERLSDLTPASAWRFLTERATANGLTFPVLISDEVTWMERLESVVDREGRPLSDLRKDAVVASARRVLTGFHADRSPRRRNDFRYAVEQIGLPSPTHGRPETVILDFAGGKEMPLAS